jgi:uncharacterized membrane protein YecN with MAPEG domain
MPTVTALYAGILGLISLGVSFPAGSLRGKLGISVGDGGNKDLLLAMRRHANFIEYVPLALILIGLLELNQVRVTAIHALGAALVVARLAHATGIKADTMKSVGRMIGAALTALVTLVASIWAITLYF